MLTCYGFLVGQVNASVVYIDFFSAFDLDPTLTLSYTAISKSQTIAWFTVVKENLGFIRKTKISNPKTLM